MTHTYKITGMTCEGCASTVKSALLKVPGITDVKIDLPAGASFVTMERHIPTTVLQDALKAYPKYQLSEKGHAMPVVPGEEHTSWIQTYKPILLIFAFITGITLLVEDFNGSFNWMKWMSHFMAGFFLTFSFFKLLNLPGFADSYSTYDIIAKRWRGWGFVYGFLELALGVAYLIQFNPLLTNAITFLVMGVSIIGVLESLFNKRKIKCACLGDVFNLPMSTITVMEDALMIAMSGSMIIILA
jgi:copper chaperone CopZ